MDLSRTRLSVEKKLYHLYGRLWSVPFRLLPRRGIDVAAEEWDNLLVLDACRYDTFEELNTVPGELRRARSRATSTPQWLKRNFSGDHDDIVYVSGNPFVSELANEGYFDLEDHVHHVEHVWDTAWDDDLGTVPPDAVSEAGLELRERFPDRRLVMHYMQPHEPFIGETNFQDIEAEGWEEAKRMWWSDRIREAYRDNLRAVLPAVEDAVQELEGKSVITSDHGEMFGKYGIIRHPKDVFLRGLYEVPWLGVEEG